MRLPYLSQSSRAPFLLPGETLACCLWPRWSPWPRPAGSAGHERPSTHWRYTGAFLCPWRPAGAYPARRRPAVWAGLYLVGVWPRLLRRPRARGAGLHGACRMGAAVDTRAGGAGVSCDMSERAGQHVEEHLTIAATAARLSLSPSTIRRAIRRGNLTRGAQGIFPVRRLSSQAVLLPASAVNRWLARGGSAR